MTSVLVGDAKTNEIREKFTVGNIVKLAERYCRFALVLRTH